MKPSIISSDPERMSGVPVFRGTRVPIQALFDILPDEGLDSFLHGFPSVSKEMVQELFEEMSRHFSIDKDWLNPQNRLYPFVETKESTVT